MFFTTISPHLDKNLSGRVCLHTYSPSLSFNGWHRTCCDACPSRLLFVHALEVLEKQPQMCRIGRSIYFRCYPLCIAEGATTVEND